MVDQYEESSISTVCWKCNGTGKKFTRGSNSSIGLIPCNVCPAQSGSILQYPWNAPHVTEGRRKRGFIRPFRLHDTWRPMAPHALVNIHEAAMKLEEGEFITALCGDWSIFQLVAGHRYTTDDLATAAIAIRQFRGISSPQRHLDIGCGLGSVLLFLANAFGKYPGCSIIERNLSESVGIEAQLVHVKLCRKSIEINVGLDSYINVIHTDLRHVASDDLAQTHSTFPCSNIYDLVTGTPPYFSIVGNQTMSDVQGRGFCSFEFRGGIEVYAACAAKTLSKTPTSRFVVCQTAIEIVRSHSAIVSQGMVVLQRVDFYGRVGRQEALFVVFVCGWKEFFEFHHMKITPIYVRNENGSYTEEYRQILIDVGKPPPI